MHWHARPVVQAFLFTVATLCATGLLVAAGLNETTATDCGQPCQARPAR